MALLTLLTADSVTNEYFTRIFLFMSQWVILCVRLFGLKLYHFDSLAKWHSMPWWSVYKLKWSPVSRMVAMYQMVLKIQCNSVIYEYNDTIQRTTQKLHVHVIPWNKFDNRRNYLTIRKRHVRRYALRSWSHGSD